MRKIIVMSKGCVERMHTVRWLDALNLPYEVFTHYEVDAARIREVCRGTVYVTNLPDLVENRNAALDVVPIGAWFVGMDDNIQRVERVHDDFYGAEEIDQRLPPPDAPTWREVYRYDATREVLHLAEQLIAVCEAQGTIYGGFASMENPFFRQRKWSSVRFVKSKLFVMKRVAGLRWGGGNYAHDSWMSAYVVAKYGCVAVNNWVHPVHKMYERGGLGHGRERRPYLDPALDAICRQFNGLVARGRGENTALRFVLTSPKSVQQWRNNNPLFEMWSPNDS